MDYQIPDKLYFKIGEVSKITDIKSHVLRYWETEFSAIRPNKSRSNQRLYRKQDVELILYLKDLLYNQGFTIAGARKKLKDRVARPAAKVKPAPTPAPEGQTVAAEKDQMALPLLTTLDTRLLAEIRQDIRVLKASLDETL